MIFVNKWDFKRIKEEYRIREVINKEISYGDRRGAVEQLEHKLDRLTEVVIQVVEALPESTKVEVANLFGYEVKK